MNRRESMAAMFSCTVAPLDTCVSAGPVGISAPVSLKAIVGVAGKGITTYSWDDVILELDGEVFNASNISRNARVVFVRIGEAR